MSLNLMVTFAAWVAGSVLSLLVWQAVFNRYLAWLDVDRLNELDRSWLRALEERFTEAQHARRVAILPLVVLTLGGYFGAVYLSVPAMVNDPDAVNWIAAALGFLAGYLGPTSLRYWSWTQESTTGLINPFTVHLSADQP